ncbi:MAG: MFS transporter [Armatimonadetes bacterium]|nr:MFS transporter [Armatimonadota bacterium]
MMLRRLHHRLPQRSLSRLSRNERDWRLFGAATFCFAFGFAVYNGLFQNYFREVLHGDPSRLGILESLREVPGLLTAPTAGSLALVADTRVGSIALLVSALGIAATGYAEQYWPLVAVTVFWSVGMHLWFSLSPAITLSLADGKEGGRHLGRMAGIGAVAVLIALAATRAAKPYLAYRALFLVAGAMIFVAGACALFISRRPHASDRPRLLLRKEYHLFYWLTFLEGCRRQIFGTFAPFVLIVVYGAKVETMLTLALVNAGVSTFAAPMIGRWIDRLGERTMLTYYYITLVAVFAGYAVIPHVGVLYAFYMVDNLLFAFAIGITTYLNGIVRPGEMTPSLTMGTTMNHIAAVVVPVTGGVLWKTVGDFRIPFWIGIGVVILSLAAARRIPERA